MTLWSTMQAMHGVVGLFNAVPFVLYIYIDTHTEGHIAVLFNYIFKKASFLSNQFFILKFSYYFFYHIICVKYLSIL